MPHDDDKTIIIMIILRAAPYFQKIQQLALDEGQLPLLPVFGPVVFVLVVGGGFVVLGVRQGVQRRIERLVGRVGRSSIGGDAVGLPESSVGPRNCGRRAAAAATQGYPDEGRSGRVHDVGGGGLLQSVVFALRAILLKSATSGRPRFLTLWTVVMVGGMRRWRSRTDSTFPTKTQWENDARANIE